MVENFDLEPFVSKLTNKSATVNIQMNWQMKIVDELWIEALNQKWIMVVTM